MPRPPAPPPLHRPPRPPIRHSVASRPVGPRIFKLNADPGLVGGYGDPPEGFPGPGLVRAQVSRTEWIAYWALAKVLGSPRNPRQPPYLGGTNWRYQVDDPLVGGRRIVGGQVIDFVIDIGTPPFAIRLQTERWHLLASPIVVKRDLFFKTHLKSYSRIIDLYDSEILGDPTGQKACRALRKAVRQGQLPSPILTGRVERLRKG